MAFPLIQCSDALFESQKRLVDFCSIDLGLFVLVHVVSSPLVSCQVDKGYLAKNVFLVLNGYLENGVRARRLVIGVVLGSHTKDTPLLDHIQKLLCTADELLIQTNHVDVALLVFTNLQHVATVQQIEQFAAVNFKKSDCDLQRTVLGLSKSLHTCYR